MPEAAKGWPAAQRVRWFRTFAMNVSQIYDGDDEPVEMKTERENEAANGGALTTPAAKRGHSHSSDKPARPGRRQSMQGRPDASFAAHKQRIRLGVPSAQSSWASYSIGGWVYA